MPESASGGPAEPQTPSNKQPDNKNLLLIGAVIVLVLLGAYWLYSRNAGDQQTAGETEVESEAELGGFDDAALDTESVTDVETAETADEATVREFTVSATNFAFTPAEMRVNEGETVRIVLTNDGTMPHDWRLDEFSAATKVIQTGQQDTIEFTASEAGTFEYYCSVGQHRQLGMVGKLVVE